MELKIKLHAANIRNTNFAELSAVILYSSILIKFEDGKCNDSLTPILLAKQTGTEVVAITTFPYRNKQNNKMESSTGPRGQKRVVEVES